ncbi:TAP-like protein-domain-containing protein [Panaeolus papilionaceus]|nr:TAP-like protein-domain-containing protein [Panaeolus papilionaceus]
MVVRLCCDVTPNTALNWNNCFNGTECAKLAVPLDHDNPNSGRQAVISLIRKVSPLGSNHPDYRGPILFNPGGPGESGIELIASGGNSFAAIVGPQFDLVSFDPRGVGASLPHASIYKSGFERLMLDTRPDAVTNANIGNVWAKIKVTNAMARQNDNGSLSFINTYQTANDMLSIIHAYGREKLQYWGLSYGTVLGATFAAMFPDKIERLVFDGVLDAEAYYAASRSKNFTTMDAAMEVFVSSCHAAGPTGCAFWAPTPSLIRQNQTKLFDIVKHYPVSVSSPAGPHGVVDIDLLRGATFGSLFSPYQDFPRLAEAYAALAQGDGSLILTMAGVHDALECPADDPLNPVRDSQTVIVCNDKVRIPSDLESARDRGPIWAYNWLTCMDWPQNPRTIFRGPFNVSHPILLVGNSGDPASPISGCFTRIRAYKMLAGFSGSVVLTQDSLGHCSTSAPSVCTQSYIRHYFLNGTLPEPGTVCPIDTSVFPGHDSTIKQEKRLLTFLSREEQGIYDAIQELSKIGLFRFSMTNW